MEPSSNSSSPALKWLVVAFLFVSLSLALTNQFPFSERSADDSFSSTVVLQKKVQDDAGKAFDIDTSFDEVRTSIAFICTSLIASLSTTRYLAASYLATFIKAPSRGPPLSHA